MFHLHLVLIVLSYILFLQGPLKDHRSSTTTHIYSALTVHCIDCREQKMACEIDSDQGNSKIQHQQLIQELDQYTDQKANIVTLY